MPEVVLSLTPSERVLYIQSLPAVVPTEQADEVGLLFWPRPQVSFSDALFEGLGYTHGHHVEVVHLRCWLELCMATSRRFWAVVYHPRHYPTNKIHITR